MYTLDEVAALLDRAHDLGLPLGPQSPIEDLTVAELDMLVSEQRAS